MTVELLRASRFGFALSFIGEGRTEALRQTQLEMLKSTDRAHPYFWASFISIGDWGPLESTRP